MREHLEIVITPFKSLPDDLLPLIEAEAADVARFLDSELILIIASGE
jgi:hypothetical protein